MEVVHKKRPASPQRSTPSKHSKHEQDPTSSHNPSQTSVDMQHQIVMKMIQDNRIQNNNASDNGSINNGHHQTQQHISMTTPVKNGRGGKREGAGRKKKNSNVNVVLTHPKNIAAGSEDIYKTGITNFTVSLNSQQPIPVHQMHHSPITNFTSYFPQYSQATFAQMKQQQQQQQQMNMQSSPAQAPHNNPENGANGEEEVTTDELFASVLSLSQKLYRYAKSQMAREGNLRQMCSLLQQERDELQSQLTEVVKQRDFFAGQLTSIDPQLTAGFTINSVLNTTSSNNDENGSGADESSKKDRQEQQNIESFTNSDTDDNASPSEFESGSEKDMKQSRETEQNNDQSTNGSEKAIKGDDIKI